MNKDNNLDQPLLLFSLAKDQENQGISSSASNIDDESTMQPQK